MEDAPGFSNHSLPNILGSDPLTRLHFSRSKELLRECASACAAAPADDRCHQLVGADQHQADGGRHHLQQPHLHQDPVPRPVREHGPAVPEHAPAGTDPTDVL